LTKKNSINSTLNEKKHDEVEGLFSVFGFDSSAVVEPPDKGSAVAETSTSTKFTRCDKTLDLFDK